MPRPFQFIGRARNTEKLLLAATMIFTGCSFDPRVLMGYSESDSSVARDGSSAEIDGPKNEPSPVFDVAPDLPATNTNTAANTQTQTTTNIITWTATTTTTVTVTSTATSVTTYEAETLATTSSAVGYNVASDVGASNGQYVQLNGAPAVGDYLEFTLPSVAAGTCAVDFYYRGFTPRGINQASIDGVNIGTPTDEYAATIVNQVLKSLGSTTLTAGNHTIRFTITGTSFTSTATSTTTTTATGTK